MTLTRAWMQLLRRPIAKCALRLRDKRNRHLSVPGSSNNGAQHVLVVLYLVVLLISEPSIYFHLCPISGCNRGADIHVCLDGNFHHSHARSAGDGPHFFRPQYILLKSVVDSVGMRIKSACQSPPKRYSHQVPDDAVDECERTHEAADEQKRKRKTDHFDDTGLMALVCRHDIPLFFANIDTPGEQQKYGIALLEHLFSLIPPIATVASLYDIGCVLDRSLRQVCFPCLSCHFSLH